MSVSKENFMCPLSCWQRGHTIFELCDGISSRKRKCLLNRFRLYTIGWVNFSEFEITVCGSCKMSKKLKWPFLIFSKFNCFAKIPNYFSTPIHSKKNKLFFTNHSIFYWNNCSSICTIFLHCAHITLHTKKTTKNHNFS